MAAHAGAKITNSNLSFTYDLSNGKSFKGKPTTNDISGGSARALTTQTPLHAITHVGTYSNGLISYEGKSVFKIENTSGGGSDYLELTQGFTNTNTSGEDYSYSFKYKPIAGNPSIATTGIVYGNGYKQPDSGNYSTNQIVTDVYLGDGWYRRKFTYTASYTGVNRIRFNISGPSTWTMYVTEFQLESGSFVTPFVAGTRSNTQAILDLTGNQTVTAESLTYSSSDVTFGVNSDYVTIGNFDDLFGSGSINATLEFWIKPPNLTNRVFIGRFPPSVADHRFYIGSYGSEWDLGWGAYAWNNGHTGTRPARDADQWQHIVVSISSGVASLYKNGVFGFTKTDTSVSQGAVPFTIGAYFNTSAVIDTSYHSAEDIDVVRVYNRALSATEIKQNFHATRGRFGV